MTNGDTSQKTFTEGYIAGYQSVRPGASPAVPAYAVPAGKTPYQYGYDLGKQKAIDFKGDPPPKKSN